MGKIAYDKYYTPPTVARWCIEKTKEIIGEDNITEWVEPSAGCGMFSHQIPGCKAYDLYPQHEYIEQADFTKLDLGGYKKGRCFIGNPPFGAGSGQIIKQFYDKSCDNGDYIAYIQPASYCNNYSNFYRFEIVYSCLLKTHYTNRELWTSFTIYKRNPDKEDWRPAKEDVKLKDVTFTKIGRDNKKRQTHKKNLDYDYCFTSFGSIMKESTPYQTSGQYVIKCHNESNRKEIISTLKWLYYYNKESKILDRKCISSLSVSENDIVKILKICIPTIK
jgi:hypothetical protein